MSTPYIDWESKVAELEDANRQLRTDCGAHKNRIAELEAELEAEIQRRWDGNADSSKELAECQARIEQYEKDVRVKSLKAAKREALIDAAGRVGDEVVMVRLIRMAEELK